MAYCYSDDCGEFAVTPMLVAPCYPSKCYEETVSYPCLPQCPKGRLVYCCEKDLPRTPPRSPISRLKERVDQCNDPHCRLHHGCNSPPRYRNRSPPPTRSPPCTPQDCCPTCCQPTCKPVKTKYVIPCYRYEDGRIERYVPTRHGRLPMSAYRWNGMQDQIHSYRGAIRYLCAGTGFHMPCVYTAVEPLRKLYPKITQEMLPVKKKNKK
ncbi:uncharacterized protein LOC131845922 isoform X2 [Achroia grisella]|uniref:uncharacterized protein LOC131845922 isoform X2 n=1 Tax=Achroia grisella TaxID=688607 RepID=UPI0027D261D6|nr:uncharacterized protein LOC131845922 isoform X2 [Achroia grisella]